jgi:hypothetical protein
MAVPLGVLGDHPRLPGEPFAVTLLVASGSEKRTFTLDGKVGVSW